MLLVAADVEGIIDQQPGVVRLRFGTAALLLVFGAKRLPELGSGLGKGIREFKKSLNEIKAEVDRPEQIQPPAQRPAQSQANPSAAPESETFNKAG